MTRIRFQQSLEDLKENLLVMAGLAEQAIQRAIEAYRVRDISICDLVSRSEIAINRMERDIDQAALDLLAMEQPMAKDLRFILSVIKINADLERVGDAAKSISDRVRQMERLGQVDLPVDIPRMAGLAADMVRRSLQSFIEGDAEVARGVLTMDDAVDEMNRAAYKSLTAVMEESGHLATGPQCAHDLPQPRARRRSRHQHRRGRHLLDSGRRRPPSQERSQNRRFQSGFFERYFEFLEPRSEWNSCCPDRCSPLQKLIRAPSRAAKSPAHRGAFTSY